MRHYTIEYTDRQGVTTIRVMEAESLTEVIDRMLDEDTPVAVRIVVGEEPGP